MAGTLSNLVVESATNPGTGTINLGGAATGRRSFAQAFASGGSPYYFITDGTNSEWGLGTFTAGTPNTLARTTVLGNSLGTTVALSFTGAVTVYNSLPAEKTPFFDSNGFLGIGGTPGAQVHTQDSQNRQSLYMYQSFASGTTQMVMQNSSGLMKFWLTAPNADLSFINTGNVQVFSFTASGSGYSYTGTWGTISDGTLKNHVSPARSYRTDLAKLSVVKYAMIADKLDAPNRLGLIAQDVAAVMPGLVEDVPVQNMDSEGNALPGHTAVKGIKTSVLLFMMLKTMQEMEADIAALRAALPPVATPTPAPTA